MEADRGRPCSSASADRGVKVPIHDGLFEPFYITMTMGKSGADGFASIEILRVIKEIIRMKA